ncbi:MAG: dTDP-4-dehydrorhamnose reductase [Phycisphaerae bacterium]|nr:dTDP-4-dehydrorhamnose reductase [Phycisphaerae bacterium]
MDKQEIALLGGRGMLGTTLTAAFRRQGFEVCVHDLPEFDLGNLEHLRHAVEAADVVVNCAAYTDVDGAESNAQIAHHVNAEAVGNLGRIAKECGKWVLHFSTDFVFDGRLDRPYVETDTPNPLSEYGRSKLAGERLLQDSGCRCCILRLEWTYGPNGNHFVTKLLRRARAGGPVSVVDDQVGAPTSTSDVAKAVLTMVNKRVTGLYHFANAGYASRYDVAEFVFERLSQPVVLKRCRTADFPALAVRPLNSRFDCRKIQVLLEEPIAPWQESLEQYLRKL